MINPAEFRPGNIVMWRKTGLVDVISGMLSYVNFYVTEDDLLHSPEDFDPYPLTEKVLLQLGFDEREVNEDGTIYGIKNFTLFYGKAENNKMYFFLNGYHNDCSIEAVHHLQNLFFFLRGETLECSTLIAP